MVVLCTLACSPPVAKRKDWLSSRLKETDQYWFHLDLCRQKNQSLLNKKILELFTTVPNHLEVFLNLNELYKENISWITLGDTLYDTYKSYCMLKHWYCPILIIEKIIIKQLTFFIVIRTPSRGDEPLSSLVIQWFSLFGKTNRRGILGWIIQRQVLCQFEKR